ncbi:ATP-binding protein [Pseudonocardia saturnea]
MLASDALSVDLHRFRHLAAQARATDDPAEATTRFGRALDLWRGEPLATLDTPWANEVRSAAEAERLAVVLDRNDTALRAGRHVELLVDLTAAAAAHPLDERLAGQLMLAQYRSGRQADALETYRRIRHRLVEELGADPGPAIRRVHQRILDGDRDTAPPAADVLPAAPPPRTPPPQAPPPQPPPPSTLPTPLTTFVGRATERAELAALLMEHRMVTAVGPGGVGKTRLALAVAADLADRFPGGVWFVDLVPVSDPRMIAPAVAAALGLGEQQARSAEDTVLGWLSGRRGLLVLDNCEHVVDGVVALVERLLPAAGQLVVLVTSRARLQVPYEWVFPVPGLSVSTGRGSNGGGSAGGGDAVELFRARAAASGGQLREADMARLADLCHALDGMALAIELAAARMPAVGLDGLEAGLADRLALFTGGRPADDRHRSLRSTLDWSCALLGEPDRAVLRRASVFAAPFTPAAARAVLGGWAPVTEGQVADGLARLVDQNLLAPVAGDGGTRYRMLETIRQYGAELLVAAGEHDEVAARHLRWCRDESARLTADPGSDPAAWRSAFDRVADDLRGALGWAADRPDHRADAHRLATALAVLCFTRGMPGESQRRYQQAAACAPDDLAAAAALRGAAGAALSRNVGDDALALFREAAHAALRAGDGAGSARDLAGAADVVNRFRGMLIGAVPPGLVEDLLAEARPLALGDLAAEAQVLASEASAVPDLDPLALDTAERAIDLARQAGDVVIESVALDQLATIQLARGEIREAAANSLLRTRILAPLTARAEIGVELADAYHFAAETALSNGDLAQARRLSETARDLPFHREEGHLATSRLILVTALAGDWDETVALAVRFRDGWERAGRPATRNLAVTAFAAATVHGLRGDDGEYAVLAGMADVLYPGWRGSEQNFGPFFGAWLLLHRGRPAEAAAQLHTPPEEFHTWFTVRWRPWYAALWAEAAVLSGDAEAAGRIDRARVHTADNPVAAAIVDRAAALAAGDRVGVLAPAAALHAAGCRYQWARTLVLAGGAERAEGAAALAALGATPMPVG